MATPTSRGHNVVSIAQQLLSESGSLSGLARWSDADFRRLLTSDETYLNGRLARFYKVKMPDDAPFERRSFDKEHRSGVLTHPLMLSSLAYTDVSSIDRARSLP